MPYSISAYTKSKAKKIGVTVRPSTRKGKKIDVFKNGKKVASVGAKGYDDFTTYSRKNKSKAKRDVVYIIFVTKKIQPKKEQPDIMLQNYYGNYLYFYIKINGRHWVKLNELFLRLTSQITNSIHIIRTAHITFSNECMGF
jgi:hypothetical protein